MNPFPQQNQSYQFYYDESNNVRKLYLSKQIDGYNIDHDPDKHNSVNFVLAGVAHTGSSSSADFDDLRQRIQLQANAQEFKLKHIAKGDFLTMLTSKKLTAFFEWLLYSDLYLHYFHLNMEYWGYVDIIDDCIHFGIQKGFIKISVMRGCIITPSLPKMPCITTSGLTRCLSSSSLSLMTSRISKAVNKSSYKGYQAKSLLIA